MSKERPKRLREDVDLEDLLLHRAKIPGLGSHGALEESFESLVEEYLDFSQRDMGEDEGGSTRNRRQSPFKWRPQDTLDLHGLTKNEAMARLEFFVQHARRRAMRCIRIITGKGLHSQAGPVLKDAAERKVIELKRNGEIKGFRWEKRSKTRSGALLVRL